jgi:hypothetical protein
VTVHFSWATKTIQVSLVESEATRIAAFIADKLDLMPDPESDAATRLEDALMEILV